MCLWRLAVVGPGFWSLSMFGPDADHTSSKCVNKIPYFNDRHPLIFYQLFFLLQYTKRKCKASYKAKKNKISWKWYQCKANMYIHPIIFI
jgi:hypothetical protein